MLETQLAHYRLIRALDESWLGTTYMAEDMRLERQVTLRILADRIRHDERWIARVQETARACALLNHPHIAQIYSIEETDLLPDFPLPGVSYSPVAFITGEHVSGPTLSEAIPPSGVPFDRGMPWLIALADALSQAHEHGCVHGALSPRHIVLSEGKTPKIINFGLIYIPRPQSDPLMSDSVTLSASLSAFRDVETIPYLAPEQLQGEEGDARSDIYSFGLIMHRLLTGKLPETPGMGDVELSIDYPQAGRETGRIIRKCLREETHRRYQSMLEVRNDLEELWNERRSSARGVVHTRRWWQRSGLETALGAFALLLAGFFLTRWFFDSGLPEQTLFPRSFHLFIDRTLGRADQAALSPDGRRIAFTHRGQLYLRDMDNVQARELTGTSGAGQPFWSPDGVAIGYIRHTNPPALCRLNVSTGESVTLCALPAGRIHGALWRADGRIIVCLEDADRRPGLYSAPDQSGSLTPFRLPNAEKGEQSIAYPSLLPDGQTLLYNILHKDGKTVELTAERGEKRKVLMRNTEGKWYISCGLYSGRMIYQYGDPEYAALWSVPLNAGSLEASGREQLVTADGLQPSVSHDGSLVYSRWTGSSERLTWVNRDGETLERIDTMSRKLIDLTVSPDNRLIAACCADNASENICVYETGGVMTALTFELSAEREPAFLPDGSEVVYVRRDENGTDLYRKRIDGSRDPRRLTSDAQEEAWPSVSPDGRYVIYSARQPDGSYDLWYRSLSEEAEPVRFTLTDTDERMPVFSPDGRYVAYAGEVNGKYEIQARSFPGGVEAGQVSEAGGLAPAWVGDDLFFVQDNTLMAASVDTRSGFSARTAAEVVFSGEPLASLLADTQTRRYAVGKDGQRFLMARPEENARIEVMIVENWIRLLDREKGR